MTACADEQHLLLGAFVLGGLSEQDRRQYRQHLRSCQHCREEIAQLVGIPRFLGLLRTPDDHGRLAPL